MAIKLKIEKFEIFTVEEFISLLSNTYKDKSYTDIGVSERIKALIGFDKLYTVFNIILGDLENG